MTRLSQITEELTAHAARTSSIAVFLSPEEWEEAASRDASNHRYRYGWVPPVLVNKRFVTHYCPEVIAEHADFDDDQLHDFLLVIRYCVSLHITHYEIPLPDRENLIDDLLYDAAPASMRLLSLVQAAALD